MNEYLILVIFPLVALIYYFSLKIQEKYQFYTRVLGRDGFLTHLLLMAFIWIVFFLLLPSGHMKYTLEYIKYPQFRLYLGLVKYLGILIAASGAILFFWSGWILGLKRIFGAQFFDAKFKIVSQTKGPFKFLRNPLYDGVTLYFLGQALIYNSLVYLLLAGESYLLLNKFLASFESKGDFKT